MNARAPLILSVATTLFKVSYIFKVTMSWDREAGGSNHLGPTICSKRLRFAALFSFVKLLGYFDNSCLEIAVCFEPSRSNSLLNTTTSETVNDWGANPRVL